MYIYIHTYIDTYIHIYIHTYIYIYIVYCYFEMNVLLSYVGVLLSIYSTPPFKIHPTAMYLYYLG